VPDLVVELCEGVISAMSVGGRIGVVAERLYNGKQHGSHSREGVLVANGPDVQAAKKMDAEIVDITPTALAYLGLAVPQHMDGKVLQELFDEPLDVQYEEMEFSKMRKTEYTDAEQAKIEKHLTDLGYI